MRRDGFSLLELSVVIAIISVVAVMGIDMGKNALRGADRINTQEELGIVQRSLEFYAKTHGYLPCPARRSLTPTDAGFGVESRTAANCVVAGDIQSATGVLIGMVPVRTLNLPDNYAADAWNNKLLYAVSTPHTNALSAYGTVTGTITVNTGSRSGTHSVLTTLPNGTAGAAATYVVLSHGPDGKGAFPLLGSAAAVACGTSTVTDVDNCNGDASFYDTEYNEGNQAASFFDDYVLWGSNALLRNIAATTPPQPMSPTDPGACSSGCEYNCAPCTRNEGAGSRVLLCAKYITSTTPCRATCVWGGGINGDGSGAIYNCP